MENKLTFQIGDFVVYPSHGVGKMISVEQHDIGGTSVELFVIEFDRDHMVLRLPVAKAEAAGLRNIAAKEEMEAALNLLSVKVKKKKAMWSRRAQEYEAKINSGNVASLADVIRELYCTQETRDQSYSERQIFQTALERFVRELSIIENIDEETASGKVQQMLSVA